MSNFSGEKIGFTPRFKQGEAGFACSYGLGIMVRDVSTGTKGLLNANNITAEAVGPALTVRQTVEKRGKGSLMRTISVPLKGTVGEIAHHLAELAKGNVPEPCRIVNEGRPMGKALKRGGRGHKVRQF